MSRFARWIVPSGFGLALAILAANAALSYVAIQEIVRGHRWVEHSREVVTSLEQAASTLKDAETGQRGYLLTGKEEYLAPFVAANRGLDPALDRLAVLTSDNPEQRARLGELRRIAGEKLGELGRTVTLMRQGDRQAALSLVQTDQGRRLMERAGAIFAEMKSEEDRLLSERSSRSGDAVRRTVASLIIASAMAASALAFMYYLKRRQEAERERAFRSPPAERGVARQDTG